MSFPRYRFARGFTLVDLLVVVVIVGLLASLSVSVIGRAMGTAKTAQCASNMCQVVQGLLQWSANNDAYLPCYVTSVSESAGYYWYGEVSRNANTAGGTTLPYCAHNPLLKWETASTVWICPANNPFQSKPATTKDCSYGINGKAVPNAPNSTPVKMVNVTKPSQCVAITDWNLKSGNQNKITADSDMATPHNKGLNIAFWDAHVEYTNAIPGYTNAIFSR